MSENVTAERSSRRRLVASAIALLAAGSAVVGIVRHHGADAPTGSRPQLVFTGPQMYSRPLWDTRADPTAAATGDRPIAHPTVVPTRQGSHTVTMGEPATKASPPPAGGMAATGAPTSPSPSSDATCLPQVDPHESVCTWSMQPSPSP